MAERKPSTVDKIRRMNQRFLVRVRRRVPPGLRLVVGLLLILGGVLGFLPVLGFWMIPLGLGVAALDIKPLLASASVDDGAKVARKCQSCHTFDSGERNGTGPNLYNVVGASLADRPRGDFKLSDSILAGADAWTYDNLNAYLEDPKSVAPKGIMSFIGLRKPKDRASVIKFLMSKTENPPEVVLDLIEPAVVETAEVAAEAVEGGMDGAEESAETP